MANGMPDKWVLGKRRRPPESFFSPGVARLTAETDEEVLRGEFGHSDGRKTVRPYRSRRGPWTDRWKVDGSYMLSI
jgi:hypothetical protein